MEENEKHQENEFNPYNQYVGCHIPNCLAKYKELSDSAKLCWARLAQFMGKNGECYPSIITLSEEIGKSDRQTIRILQELENNNFIRIQKPAGSEVLQHLHNRYYFLKHPIFTTDNYSSPSEVTRMSPLTNLNGNEESKVTRMSPSEVTRMSPLYKENHIKEPSSKEEGELFAKEQTNKPLLRKKQKAAPDRSLFNKISPVVSEKKEEIKSKKPSVREYSILEFWKNSGLHTPGEKTKAHAKNIEALNEVLNGNKFKREYTKEHFFYSIQNFALAALNLDYYPIKKSSLQKMRLHEFIYNPFGTNGDRSLFLKYLEGPPDLVKGRIKSVPAKNPILAKLLKEWYVRNVLGDAKVQFTIENENYFVVSSNKLLKFLEDNKTNLRLNMHYGGEAGKARILCESLQSSVKSIDMIKPYWFQSDDLFSITLPKYLKSKDMLISKQRMGI